MHHEPNAATFFNGFAETFDTIYDQKRNVFMRWVDCTFRSDMFIRYALTFEALGQLKGSTILDVGCGSGPYIIEAFKRGACRVTGIDPAPNMLALVRQRLQQNGVGEDRCELLEGIFPGCERGAARLRHSDGRHGLCGRCSSLLERPTAVGQTPCRRLLPQRTLVQNSLPEGSIPTATMSRLLL